MNNIKKEFIFFLNKYLKGCENGSNTCTIWIRLRYCQSVSLFIQSSFWQIWYEIWSQIMLQFWSRFTGILYVFLYVLHLISFIHSWSLTVGLKNGKIMQSMLFDARKREENFSQNLDWSYLLQIHIYKIFIALFFPFF